MTSPLPTSHSRNEDELTVASRRLIAAIGYGSFLLIGWTSVLVPALIRSIEDGFHESDVSLGVFYLVWAIFYAGGALGGGLLTERLGRRVVLSTAGALLGLGLAGQAVAPSWVLFVLAAVPGGWGAGAIDSGVNGMFLALYPATRGGALNLLHLFFALGALLSPLLVGQLVAAGLSWQPLFAVTGVWGVVMAVSLASQNLPHGVTSRPSATESETSDRVRGGAVRGSRLPLAALAFAIGCYVAAELGVSSWLVRFLSAEPVSTATAALSFFWGGIMLGRLLSSRVADRLEPVTFAGSCAGLAAVALVAAIVAPAVPLSIAGFAVAGFFFGPVYPMIMVIGGALYPNRLAAVSGGLGAAAVVGSIVYPPIVGLVSVQMGIIVGMLGTAVLALGSALSLVVAAWAAGRAVFRGSVTPSID